MESRKNLLYSSVQNADQSRGKFVWLNTIIQFNNIFWRKIINWVVWGNEKVWNMVSTLKDNITGRKEKSRMQEASKEQ